MTDSLIDWRLFGTHDHLNGATLWWRTYAPRNQIMAQDQCAFCWATFARAGENVWHEGYSTQPPYGAGGPAPAASAEGLDAGAADEEATEDDEYITQVIAAVSAADVGGEPSEAPGGAADAADPAAEAEASSLAELPLPAASAEPAKIEPVYWICPQCFDDFHQLFGWTVANTG